MLSNVAFIQWTMDLCEHRYLENSSQVFSAILQDSNLTRAKSSLNWFVHGMKLQIISRMDQILADWNERMNLAKKNEDTCHEQLW